MATFRIINNTNSNLPLSSSSNISPGGERFVSQLTIELKRLEVRRLITIIKLDIEDESLGDGLATDYVGVKADPATSSNFVWTDVSW